jgi:hypothetical protein
VRLSGGRGRASRAQHPVPAAPNPGPRSGPGGRSPGPDAPIRRQPRGRSRQAPPSPGPFAARRPRPRCLAPMRVHMDVDQLAWGQEPPRQREIARRYHLLERVAAPVPHTRNACVPGTKTPPAGRIGQSSSSSSRTWFHSDRRNIILHVRNFARRVPVLGARTDRGNVLLAASASEFPGNCENSANVISGFRVVYRSGLEFPGLPLPCCRCAHEGGCRPVRRSRSRSCICSYCVVAY